MRTGCLISESEAKVAHHVTRNRGVALYPIITPPKVNITFEPFWGERMRRTEANNQIHIMQDKTCVFVFNILVF
jgi:hypothetical protein